MKTIAYAGACAALAAAGLLVACGGGGNSTPAASTNVAGSDVPIAATQDPDAAYTFVASVAAKTSESSDPIVVGTAALATSDVNEPKSP